MKGNESLKVTLKQVAFKAGVSVSTVSRVLNRKSCVNEETKKIVLQVIEELDYRPNVLARGLKKGFSSTISLIIPSIENPMFPLITRGVEDVARKNGFIVILCNTDENDIVEREYIEAMKNRWIDGFIVCSMSTKAEYIRSLRGEGYPLVLINRFEESDIGKVDIIGSDNFKIGYDATEYLIGKGRRNIVFIQGNPKLLLYRERLNGYKCALEKHGIKYDDSLVLIDDGKEDLYKMIVNFMDTHPKVDAYFCSSDPKAIVAMRALHDKCICIPEKVAVMGVDDISFSLMLEPPLTTVSQHLYDMGVKAAENLINQINFKNKFGKLPEPENIVINTDIVERASTK